MSCTDNLQIPSATAGDFALRAERSMRSGPL